ncbi:MAG TPA: hypothetical protein VM183_08170 [Burkholderiales bacterium]|nr:hypothetical protein [Burkholderiales bacterium]
MSIAIHEPESTMLKKILLITAALGFSSAALADPPHWAPAHGWRAKHDYRHGYYERGYHAYAPRPVYVVPAPRIVYAPPPPVMYYPAPAYRPAPVYAAPGVSIRFNLPL